MEDKYKKKIGKEIYKIAQKHLFEINDQKTRDEIGYEIMRFLEKKQIDFTSLNLHTSPEVIHAGGFDVDIDGNKFIWRKGELNCWT
jgi:hypothetical protein